jgi:predicted enzyme related to lactoylglutathione lyase
MDNFLAPRLAGVELYFDDLGAAKQFYIEALGLQLEEDDPNHHVKFSAGPGFLCLERKGVEDYPSAEKAVVFLEVASLQSAVARVGASNVLRSVPDGEQPWAAVRDPEGHTVLLLQRKK